MIINTLNENKIKILVDKVDLQKAGITPEKFISNSTQTLSYIENLLKFNTNLYGQSIIDPNNMKLVLKDYFIYTYNYIVFYIILFYKEK